LGIEHLPESSGVDISVVSPVYKGEHTVGLLVESLSDYLPQICSSHEIVLVEDGSSEESWQAVLKACEGRSNVRALKLSRNFGQHYAVTAGLEHARGNTIVIMDCDLQDRPESIGMLYEEVKKGYHVVFTKRKKRRHSFLKSLFSVIYNRAFTIFSGSEYSIDYNSLVMMTSKAKEAFMRIKDQDRLYIQLLKWIGFRSTEVIVEHEQRAGGKSTYSFARLLKIAIQGWTFHSDRLLRYSIYFGFGLSGLSFLSGLLIIYRYFAHGFLPGWPSLFLTVLFSTGVLLISIGITGIYIGKIFIQVKDRPLYIIEEKVHIK